MSEDVLVFDIETRTFGKPDAQKDVLKLFGCYSYKTEKYYMLSDKEQIQKVINAHKFLVGFNILKYDNIVLENNGIDLKYKINIDLMKIFKERSASMKIKKGMLGDLLMEHKLSYICEMLEIVTKEENKLDIDYKVFQKDSWTPDELKEITKYANRDVEITKKLYEWVEEYFSSFKPFLHEVDVDKKVYLTGSIAKFAYKAICKAMSWDEIYGDYGIDDGESISGGYVAYPAGSRFEGDIFCLDFNSLYPHVMIQCNLYGRKKGMDINDNRETWFGGGKWKVEGSYYSDELSGVGELLKKWYSDRVVFKKVGDRREYTIKIILNTIYGILCNNYYTRVYDKIAGGDCTRLGRQWTKYARKIFREYGYEILYTDTDSVYIKDVKNDREEMLKVKEKIIKEIKDSVPFPQDTFDMGIDDEIKYMYFFKGKNKVDPASDSEMDSDDFINKPKNFMKKNYIYVTRDNKVKIKNLGLNKKSNSALSKKIFWDYLVPQIKQGQILFSKTYIRNIMNELLSKDLMLAAMRKSVGAWEQYKDKSPGSLPGQIAKNYGPGIHFMIPTNDNYGVGKGKYFCSVDEFKEKKLKVEHINLDNVWSELNYFIKAPVVKNIFSFEAK